MFQIFGNLDLYKTQKGTIWCFLNEVCLHQIKLWAVWLLQRNKLEQEKVKFSIFIVCKLRQVYEIRLAFMQLRNLRIKTWRKKLHLGSEFAKCVNGWPEFSIYRIFHIDGIDHGFNLAPD